MVKENIDHIRAAFLRLHLAKWSYNSAISGTMACTVNQSSIVDVDIRTTWTKANWRLKDIPINWFLSFICRVPGQKSSFSSCSSRCHCFRCAYIWSSTFRWLSCTFRTLQFDPLRRIFPLLKLQCQITWYAVRFCHRVSFFASQFL